jgi:hypothetical protein
MLLHTYAKSHVAVMRVGLVCLIAGMLLLRSHRADGLAGLFYGLAIGLLLLSLRMRCAKTAE